MRNIHTHTHTHKHTHGRTWNMARNTEKLGKLEMHTVGPGICKKTDINGKEDTNTV